MFHHQLSMMKFHKLKFQSAIFPHRRTTSSSRVPVKVWFYSGLFQHSKAAAFLRLLLPVLAGGCGGWAGR